MEHAQMARTLGPPLARESERYDAVVARVVIVWKFIKLPRLKSLTERKGPALNICKSLKSHSGLKPRWMENLTCIAASSALEIEKGRWVPASSEATHHHRAHIPQGRHRRYESKNYQVAFSRTKC
ncbi:hypothetical protein ABW19_dt0202288 [Dactylella cylindrospora]|nr:hypothetical protein ABW19_dt0202288 [Dactylella cylindrospora]